MVLLFPVGIPAMYYFLLRQERCYLNPYPGQDAMVNMRAVKYVVAVDENGVERIFYKKVDVDRVMGEKSWVSKSLKIVTEKRFTRFDEDGNKDAKGLLIVKNLGIDSVKDCNVNDDEITDLLELGAEVYSLDEEGAMVEALRRRDEVVLEKKSIGRLAFLFANYEPNCWSFEVFESLRRLILTGGQVFLSPGTASQIVISMCICLGSMRVYAQYTPFINVKHDRLAEIAQWQTFFTMFAALCIKVDITSEDGYNQLLFDYALVGLQCVAPVLGMLQVASSGLKDAVVARVQEELGLVSD